MGRILLLFCYFVLSFSVFVLYPILGGSVCRVVLGRLFCLTWLLGHIALIYSGVLFFGYFFCTNHHCLYRFYITWLYRLLFLKKFIHRRSCTLRFTPQHTANPSGFSVAHFFSSTMPCLRETCLLASFTVYTFVS